MPTAVVAHLHGAFLAFGACGNDTTPDPSREAALQRRFAVTQSTSARRYRTVAAIQPATAIAGRTTSAAPSDRPSSGTSTPGSDETIERAQLVTVNRAVPSDTRAPALPQEDEGESPPHGPPEPETRRDEQARVGGDRERRRETDAEREGAGSRDESGDGQRHGCEGDDERDRREDRRGRQHPARHRLEPDVHEEPVLDEVADHRGAEPERRERHDDAEPVQRRHVRRGPDGIVVEPSEDAEQDRQRSEGRDAEQPRHVDLRPGSRR